MTATTWALAGVLALAGALCLWAWWTGDPRDSPRVPQHGRWVGEGSTRRLPRLEAPTEILRTPVELGRCSCLHVAHIGRCRRPGCPCKSPEGYTDTRAT